MYLGCAQFVTQSSKSSERRRGRRVPLSTAASGLDPRTTTPVSDLSDTGCFVHTEEPLAIGATIDLRFTVFPEEPVLFIKASSSVIGAGDEIVLPRVSAEVDYEGELAVVIGRTCHDVGDILLIFGGAVLVEATFIFGDITYKL